MIKALSNLTIDLPTGSVWDMAIESSELPTVTVITPSGTQIDVTPVLEGGFTQPRYSARYVPQEDGRHIALANTATQGNVIFQAFTQAVSMNDDFPDADELSDWMGGTPEHSWDATTLAEALAVESANQRRRCRIPVAYPADLREALLRRAARNLEMRKQLTEQPRSDGEFAIPNFVPPGRDQEIRRLESPWFKLPVG